MFERSPSTTPAAAPLDAEVAPASGDRIVEYIPIGADDPECDYVTDLSACHHGRYARGLAVRRIE